MENQITDYLNILYKSTLLINILIFSQGKWFASKLEKTEMLSMNTDARLMEEIEQQTGIKCVEGLRHLGIEVRKTYKSTVEATNENFLQQTESK